MPVPSHSRQVQIAGVEMTAEAILNNCSDLWTATVRTTEKLVATGAGSSPEAALANAIERAEAAMAETQAALPAE